MNKISISFLKEKTDAECRELAGHYYRRARRAEKERDHLRAEVEALRKDAERYRWLRDGNNVENSEAIRIAVHHYGDEWDEMIDNAMGGGNK